MSDIIADINRRIEEAKTERDKAIAEVKALKAVLAKNKIVLHDGVAYMFVGTGNYTRFHCSHCPFVKWTREDSQACIIGRDACRCADAGGRYYKVSELNRDFQEKMKADDECAMLEERIRCLRKAIRDISDIADKALKKEGEK